MKKIELPQGKYAIVDDEDYPVLSRFTWSLGEDKNKGIQKAVTTIGRRYVNMATFLIPKTREKVEYTHLNKNGLDYRKENLKIVTAAEARHGRYQKRIDNSSGFKGVWMHRKTGLIYAEIAKEGKRYRLGCFKTPEEAAEAYNKKALELYGEFAYQNKI